MQIFKILIACSLIISPASFALASETDNYEELKLQITELMKQIEQLQLNQGSPANTPALPSSTTAVVAPTYTQTFSDSRFGVSFSYNQKAKFTATTITDINGRDAVARSLTLQNKEAAFIGLSTTTEAARLRFGLGMLSMFNGTANEYGETSYISQRPVYIENKLHSGVFDLERKNKDNDSAGAFIWMQEIRNESGTVVGSVNTTVAWGDYSTFTQATTKNRYNGKPAPQVPHFETRAEAEVFMKEVMATMKIDPVTIVKLIE